MKEHNAQVHQLQTELDKLETNVSKATREGVNEANKIELKRQRTEEKIKQDEQKIDNSKNKNSFKIAKIF